MLAKQHFSTEQAREFGDKFGLDWDWSCSNDDQVLIEFGILLECESNASFAEQEEQPSLLRWNRDRLSQHQYRVRNTVRISEEEYFVS